MDISDLADQVSSKEDFISFLQKLQQDYRINKNEWENPDLPRYFEAMEAFLEGSTNEAFNKIDFIPSWSLFANILLVASVYE
ncbi:MAG: hypothetical protein ABIU63_17735 [Chitinophagaceae bacterium]